MTCRSKYPTTTFSQSIANIVTKCEICNLVVTTGPNFRYLHLSKTHGQRWAHHSVCYCDTYVCRFKTFHSWTSKVKSASELLHSSSSETMPADAPSSTYLCEQVRIGLPGAGTRPALFDPIIDFASVFIRLSLKRTAADTRIRLIRGWKRARRIQAYVQLLPGHF